jgi:Ca2+-transporting ATPase
MKGGIVLSGNLVTVEKNGKLINIEEAELRKNDTVIVQTGELAPADIVLTETPGVEVDEFELTGEINPVIKEPGGLVRMGSKILRGKGKGTVIATGDETEYGKILKQTLEQKKTHKFKLFKKKYLILVLFLLPALVLKLLYAQYPVAVLLEYVCLSVALILLQNSELFRQVLLTGEIKKLGRLKIHIRDPEVMEALRKIDTVCFDKTGVLTTRQMEVKSIYSIDNKLALNGLSDESRAAYLIKTGCALCNDVLFYEKIETATAIDKALIAFAVKNGVDMRNILQNARRFYEMPFDSENRYMACGFRLSGGKPCYFVKGDPEIILNKCGKTITASGDVIRIDDRSLLACKSKIMDINREGGTALALAYTMDASRGVPTDYVFLCLLQLENALQHGAKETVKQMMDKGIRCIMLTGDRGETAVKISETCGIAKNSHSFLAGRTIERMELAEVARQSDYCSVFARLMPSQKGIIVRLLQQRHHYVAMIGDGPNDGIALKVADVSISFQENSSPIARRLANILIQELTDVLRLIDGSNRLKRKVSITGILRSLVVAAILLSQYVWIIELLFRYFND